VEEGVESSLYLFGFDHCEFAIVRREEFRRLTITLQIRSIYRLIESAMGINGYPFKHP